MDFSKVKGIIPPIVTPLNEREEVDEGSFRKLLNHCYDVGIHGIFVAGTNGECMALTQEQRNRAIKIALDEVGSKMPVMAGVMDSSTKRVIENVKMLEQMGGEIAVVTPAFYWKSPSDAEIIRHFEEVARNTNISVFAYNIPPFTGSNISNKAIFEIAKIDNVIGYKDSAANMIQFQQCIYHFKDTDFKLFMGNVDLVAMSLLMGAVGFVPTLAPIFHELYVKLYNAAISGDMEKTLTINKVFVKSCKLGTMAKSSIAANKYAISLLGLCDERVAAPMEQVTAQERAAISAFVEEILEESRAL
jgi:4-hydroxy-tetrahydrodipicolinate synthase